MADEKTKDEGEEQPVDPEWTRGDGSPATPNRLPQEEIEKRWKRGAELDDAEAIAAANQAGMIANMGTTGSSHGGGVQTPMATGGAEERATKELAAEAAEIRKEAAKREAQKVEQTGTTNTTPAPAQAEAVEEGQVKTQEAGSGEAEGEGEAKAKQGAKTHGGQHKGEAK